MFLTVRENFGGGAPSHRYHWHVATPAVSAKKGPTWIRRGKSVGSILKKPTKKLDNLKKSELRTRHFVEESPS